MEESGETVGENLLPTKVHGFTKDLVHKLTGRIDSPVKLERKVLEHNDGNGRLEDEGEIELSLGLSLNGKFGVDPKRTTLKLFRGSTMSTITLKYEQNQPQEVESAVDAPPLIRTCSLYSVRIEEESRKRRKLQSLKRVEAKKRRMEKQRLSKEGREKVDNNNNNRDGCIKNSSEQGFVCNNGDGAIPALLLLQGSELVSQGSGSSSGISELESNSIQDSSLTNDAKYELDRKFPGKTNPITNDSKSELDRKLPRKTNSIRSRECRTSDHKPPVPPPRRVFGIDKQPPNVVVAAEEMERKKKMEEGIRKKMPFVSTVGKGQNGKRIEGFLYEYRKGEEVKIVCVCHGSTFSPAEFMKHAGGDEVENPFKHIVVSSLPLPCL